MRNRRVDLNLTQAELADSAKLHRTYVTDIEAGHRNLSMLTYGRLTEALSCALSLPILDAERSMNREAMPSVYGIKGAPVIWQHRLRVFLMMPPIDFHALPKLLRRFRYAEMHT